MIPILVEIQGAKELDSGFVQLSDVFSDLTPVFERLRDKFFPSVQKKFDVGGPGWPSLSTETEARKAALYGGPSQILIASKALYSSFATGAPGSVERIFALFADVGTSIFYATFHQEGRGVPERKIIDVSPTEEKEMVAEVEGVLGEQIRKLGFAFN